MRLTFSGTFPSLLNRFDFANSNINDEYLNKMNPHHVPDVVRLTLTSLVSAVKLPWPLVAVFDLINTDL